MRMYREFRSGDEHYTPQWVWDWLNSIDEIKQIKARYKVVVDPWGPNMSCFQIITDLLKQYQPREIIVFGNPPFSKSILFFKWFIQMKIDFIMFGSTLNILTTTRNRYGVRFLGPILYENSNKIVQTALYSNLWKDIKSYRFTKKTEADKDYMAMPIISSASLNTWCGKSPNNIIENIDDWDYYGQSIFGGAIKRKKVDTNIQPSLFEIT